MKATKIFFSAGEASGDLHAGEVIRAIKELRPEAEFAFLGGDNMAAAAGCEPLVHYREMAYMGFSEVLRNLGKVKANLRKAEEAIRAWKPDVVVLVDYPSFNLRLARLAHELGIPVYYYIAPKVWAWKKWRVHQLRKYCRKILSILPFEVPFFEKYQVPVEYVGNPSAAEIEERRRHLTPADSLLAKAGLPAGSEYIALVPGSRRSEIKNNLPLMAEAASRFPAYRAIVAGAPGIPADFYRRFTDLPVVENETFSLMGHAAAALVTSGTATLECALLGTPQAVCYRGGGSRMTYEIMKRILTIPFVSLPNLVAGREIVRELLEHQCTSDAMADQLNRLLPGGADRERQTADFSELRRQLEGSRAPQLAAASILGAD